MDAALRTRWVAAGFPEDTTARDLRQLMKTVADWLHEVVARHGWPGPALVGRRAAEAACRLLQHLEGEIVLQQRCLRLLRASAERQDAPWRQVAYVQDSLRLASGRAQEYGTKLQRVDGRLVPYPIRAPDRVDARRAAMGMEPLTAYLRRAQRYFDKAESALPHGSSGSSSQRLNSHLAHALTVSAKRSPR